MNRSLLLVAALALPLAACADSEPAETEVVTVDPAPPVAEDPIIPEVSLQGTIDAAGSDLTALPAGAALDNIGGWIAQLDGATFTNAAEIRQGLMTLRDQLQASPLDGAAIGATLTNLGTWTAESAPDNAEIQTLAGALRAGGETLTGM